MRKKRTYLCFLWSLILFSCKKENAFDCFKSTGKTISEFRNVGSFSEIEMNDKINVTIYKGNDFKLEVLAGENIIKNVYTKVIEGVLIIDNNNKCNFVRGYKHQISINITVPYIKLVSNKSVSTLTFADNFHQDTLVVRIENSGDAHINGTYNQIRTSTHGNGDFYLNGKTNSLFVYTNGTNYIRAQNLLVKDYLFVETITIGDCYMNATGLKKFDYHIESDGNIYYTGQPMEINNVGKEGGNVKGRVINGD